MQLLGIIDEMLLWINLGMHPSKEANNYFWDLRIN